MKAKFLFITAAFSLILFSCTKKENPLDLQSGELLSISVKWAIVISPVTSLKKTASLNSMSMQNVKAGDILQVKGMKYSGGKKWYIFEGGYLEEHEVIIYQNYFQAENAQKEMKEARRENDKDNS